MYPISKINVLFWHIVLWIADWITFHKFGITGQYLSQYICLLDNTREHLRDPIFNLFLLGGGATPLPDHPRATPAASRTGLRPVIVQSQTLNIMRTTSKIQATPLGAHVSYMFHRCIIVWSRSLLDMIYSYLCLMQCLLDEWTTWTFHCCNKTFTKFIVVIWFFLQTNWCFIYM